MRCSQIEDVRPCRSHESASRRKGMNHSGLRVHIRIRMLVRHRPGMTVRAMLVTAAARGRDDFLQLATWRAKAPRPAAVAVTVVCGFLPTKALSTAT